jgi:hypothetical protein
MMNNPLVLAQANIWAKKTLAGAHMTNQDRITAIYVAALGRPPSPRELAEANDFVNEQVRDDGQLQSVSGPHASGDFPVGGSPAKLSAVAIIQHGMPNDAERTKSRLMSRWTTRKGSDCAPVVCCCR